MLTKATTLIIASFCVTMTLQYTPHTPCNAQQSPLPLELRVEGCRESPCRFVRGKDLLAEWDFNVVANAEKLRPIVKVKALGVTINYPIPEQNACNSLSNGECPLDVEEIVTYALRMPILASYPKIGIHSSFSLVDENNHVHVCFEIDAVVVD